MQHFPDRLRHVRSKSGITQIEMARMLNINERSYRGYEYGEGYPSVSHLLEMSKILSVSLDYLFGIEVTEASSFEKELLQGFRKLSDIRQREILKLIND